jgi:hypothetical protein
MVDIVVLPLALAALFWIFTFVALILFAIERVRQDETKSSPQKDFSQNAEPPEDSTPSFILSILKYILKASEDTTHYSFELEVRISNDSVTTTSYFEVSFWDTAEELKTKISHKEGHPSLEQLCLFLVAESFRMTAHYSTKRWC